MHRFVPGKQMPLVQSRSAVQGLLLASLGSQRLLDDEHL
jgi:hypothetical protein